jgi:hypothetical protein
MRLIQIRNEWWVCMYELTTRKTCQISFTMPFPNYPNETGIAPHPPPSLEQSKSFERGSWELPRLSCIKSITAWLYKLADCRHTSYTWLDFSFIENTQLLVPIISTGFWFSILEFDTRCRANQFGRVTTVLLFFPFFQGFEMTSSID